MDFPGDRDQVSLGEADDDDPPDDPEDDDDNDDDSHEDASRFAAADDDVSDLLVFDVDDEDDGDEEVNEDSGGGARDNKAITKDNNKESDEAQQATAAAEPATASESSTKTPVPYYRGLGKRLEHFARLAADVDLDDETQMQARAAAVEFFRAENANALAPSAPAPLTWKDSGPTCRICRDSDTKEAVASPCQCRGSVARVHMSCLERWLAESDTSSCELCGHLYRTVRTPRYNVLASIPRWMVDTGSADLIFDLVAFVVFTPVALLGTHLGIHAEDSAYFQVSLMAAIDLVYSAWLTMRLHYHVLGWYSWWRRKANVKVLLDTDEANGQIPKNQ